MKKVLLCLCCIFISFQLLNAQTTIEEYNYITKGIQVQQESGLDMKKGYILVDTEVSSSVKWGDGTERKFQFLLLKKTSETPNKLKAIVAVYQNIRNGKYGNEYFCIPTYSSSDEVWQKAFQDYNKMSNQAWQSFAWALAKISSKYILK